MPHIASKPTLTIDTIGLNKPIDLTPLDQTVIDDGHIVVWNGCYPTYRGCTVWLAGHRTSRGGVFRQLPDLEPGDVVVIGWDHITYRYQVTDKRIVPLETKPGDHDVYGDLILQTSWINGTVWFVYAEQMSVTYSD